MTMQRFCLKFFAAPETQVDDAIFIDIFHEWVRLKTLPGVLLDVADYRHVPEGPGIMLIAHEINFAMDYAGGPLGLLAQRKVGPGETHQARLLDLVRTTITFGTLLEADPRMAGKLRLEAGSFHYMSNDRLLAPNTGAAFAALRPDLEAIAALIYPDRPASISRLDNDPRDRLTAVVDSGSALTMQALLETAVA